MCGHRPLLSESKRWSRPVFGAAVYQNQFVEVLVYEGIALGTRTGVGRGCDVRYGSKNAADAGAQSPSRAWQWTRSLSRACYAHLILIWLSRPIVI